MRNIAVSVPPIAKLHKQKIALLAELENKNKIIEGINFVLEHHKRRLERAGIISDLPPILQELFIKWVKMGVPGWCSDDNIKIIEDCINTLPKGSVIEIGSFCGLSTAIISYCLIRNKKENRFFSVDDWFFEGYADRKNTYISGIFTGDDWREHTETLFKATMKLINNKLKHSHIKLNSNAFFASWCKDETIYDLNNTQVLLGGDIAFAYIDGDHSYEQAKNDFINVDKYLVKGGYVFFDDSADNTHFGCKDVAKEVEKLKNYKLVSPQLSHINKCFMKIN